MTPETEAARHELEAFRRRRSPEGRFAAYCKGRSRHFFGRLLMTLFCFAVFLQIAPPRIALVALAIVGLADALESLILFRMSRGQAWRAHLPALQAITAFLGALQALTLVYFVALLATYGGESTRTLEVVICLAAIMDAALLYPLHRAAALARCMVLGTALVAFFALDMADVAAPDMRLNAGLTLDLVAGIFMAQILVAFVRHMLHSRERSEAKHALALEKACELAETAAALDASRATARKLAMVAQSVNDSIILTDEQGVITWVNPAFTDITGFDAREAVGQYISLVNGPNSDPAGIDVLMTARREAKPARLQILNRRKDGTDYWVETSLTPVLDAKGHLASVISVERNIDHIKAREAALAEANRVKQAFLATVSHELRTPLNGIIGNAEMLLETPMDAEQAAMARTIGQSGEALLTIVNDILDFSALEAGRLSVCPAVFDPRSLVIGIADLLRPVAARKGISFELEIADSLPERVVGDAGRIRQILSNLLGNAIKFTSAGEVRLNVAVPEGAGAGHFRFEVSDTGIGIAPDRIERIFESFTQANAAIAGSFGGTGLGLAISRQLAEAMGGTLTARSTVGAGSAFILELDLPSAEAEAAVPAAEGVASGSPPCSGNGPAAVVPGDAPALGARARPPPDVRRFAPVEGQRFVGPDGPDPADAALPFAGWRILVADDKATNRRLLDAMLKGTGAELDFAASGKEAVAAFLSGPPDIVLMDMRMPELDGAGAARTIRAVEAARGTSHAPIIALTANALAEDRAECSAAGMNGFLSKPLRRSELFAALQRHGSAIGQRRAAG